MKIFSHLRDERQKHLSRALLYPPHGEYLALAESNGRDDTKCSLREQGISVEETQMNVPSVS